MSAPELTKEMCYAAGRDAANLQMRQAGRTAWALKDYRLACAEFARLDAVRRLKALAEATP